MLAKIGRLTPRTIWWRAGVVAQGGEVPWVFTTPASIPNNAGWYSSWYDKESMVPQTPPALEHGEIVVGWFDSTYDYSVFGSTGRYPTYFDAVDPANDYLTWSSADAFHDSSTPTPWAFSWSQPYSVYVVKEYYDAAGATHYLCDGGANDQAAMLVNDNVWELRGGSTLTGDAAPTSGLHLAIAEFNGASSKLYLDGVQKVSGNAGSNALSGFTMLNRFDNLVAKPTTKLYDVGIVKAVMTTAEKNALGTYFAAAHGFSWTTIS